MWSQTQIQFGTDKRKSKGDSHPHPISSISTVPEGRDLVSASLSLSQNAIV